MIKLCDGLMRPTEELGHAASGRTATSGGSQKLLQAFNSGTETL